MIDKLENEREEWDEVQRGCVLLPLVAPEALRGARVPSWLPTLDAAPVLEPMPYCASLLMSSPQSLAHLGYSDRTSVILE